jgi:hypothetical protein
MTTPFSLGNTRPSERKSCFSGNHWTTTLFSLGNTRPSERKVVFRWTLSHDDPVLSWKHATLREKSRVPVDPIDVVHRNAFLLETRDPPRGSRVSVETIGRRPCFLLETRDPPREKSGSGGPYRTTTLFCLGSTRPSERKVVFRWTPSLWSIETRFSWKHATLREKVVFQWKPLDDDPVFSWKHATLRETSRVPVDFVARASTATITSTCARAQHQPPSALRGFNHLPFPTLLCAVSLRAPPPVPTRTPYFKPAICAVFTPQRSSLSSPSPCARAAQQTPTSRRRAAPAPVTSAPQARVPA